MKMPAGDVIIAMRQWWGLGAPKLIVREVFIAVRYYHHLMSGRDGMLMVTTKTAINVIRIESYVRVPLGKYTSRLSSIQPSRQQNTSNR